MTASPQPAHRAPHECPVCRDDLHVTQLGCDNCGTGITGDFEQCDFCALEGKDLDVLRVFLASRGNMKDLERHLGVSYPTARARFDDLLRKLGLGAGAPRLHSLRLGTARSGWPRSARWRTARWTWTRPGRSCRDAGVKRLALPFRTS